MVWICSTNGRGETAKKKLWNGAHQEEENEVDLNFPGRKRLEDLLTYLLHGTVISAPALYKLVTFHVSKRVSIFLFLWHETSSRSTPPGDTIGGVVYLRNVLSPEEESRLCEWYITGGLLRGGVVSTLPNPQPGGPGHPF